MSSEYKNKIVKNTIYSLIENLIANVFIFYIFFTLNPIKENFILMNVHPLLLVVAFTALKYGNYIGVMSAFIASITFLYVYYLLGLDMFLFIMDFDHYKFLLMFFLVAVILGKYKDTKDYMIDSLRQKISELKQENEAVVLTAEKFKYINDELKGQIIGTEDSVLSLYEIASSLETINPEEIYTEIMGVLSKFLHAKAVSIYTIDKNKSYMRLKLKMGETQEIKNSIKINDNPHFVKVIEEKKVVKIDAFESSETPLLSAPILKNGEVIAIINIEDLEFDFITEYTRTLFGIIVDWTSKALIQSLEYERVVTDMNYYPGTRMMKMDKFNLRLEEEEKRAKKFNSDFKVIKFLKGNISLNVLDEKLNNAIRDVDIIAFNDVTEEVHLLLPITLSKDVPLIKERIFSEFDYAIETIGYHEKDVNFTNERIPAYEELASDEIKSEELASDEIKSEESEIDEMKNEAVKKEVAAGNEKLNKKVFSKGMLEEKRVQARKSVLKKRKRKIAKAMKVNKYKRI
ncbi:MAG: hypothetical protein COA82_04395 [Alkaliphilus sp.]|nr:GAF domain-containing protein [bacterium AH-315-L21]PHS35488.1 MAG: hypothetical protein COA82_04395 [Alkaliphilus sp.]